VTTGQGSTPPARCIPFDLFELCADAERVDEVLRRVHPAHLISTVSRGGGSAYSDEAMIYWAQTRFRPSAAEREHLETLALGIHPDHPLFDVREAIVALVQRERTATEGVRLLVWGASARSGRELFRQAAVLARCREIREELRATNRGLDITNLVMEWARASGVKHRSTLETLPRLCRDVLLNERPASLYESLDDSVCTFVGSIAGDKVTAYLLFRCLQRAVAFERNGEVRWRAAWLSGKSASADAIPGASGPAMRRKLTRLLHERVLEMTEGWSAGRKAATFRFRVPIQRGRVDARLAAARWGVQLDSRQAPKKSSRRR
jgi:hypothetical protein